MNITALTTACHRPEAWKLAESYMRRQTLQPFQWLVLDDDEPKTVCTMGQDYHYVPQFKGRGSLTNKFRYALENDLVKGDAIVVWENDDYFAPDWIEWCAEQLVTRDLVGEGRALYYNVRGRWYFEHTNLQHASLCQTAIHRRAFPELLNECLNSLCPFLDVRIWKSVKQNRQVIDPYRAPNKRRVIGIKGMPGRVGYGGGHVGRDRSAADDQQLVKLRSLIGDDADAYAPFFDSSSIQLPPERNGFIAAATPAKPKISAREWHRQYLQKNGKPPMRYL